MGIRCLFDSDNGCCLFSSVTMLAFGPVFVGQDAEDFRDWWEQCEDRDLGTLDRDAIEERFRKWQAQPVCETCGERVPEVKEVALHRGRTCKACESCAEDLEGGDQ